MKYIKTTLLALTITSIFAVLPADAAKPEDYSPQPENSVCDIFPIPKSANNKTCESGLICEKLQNQAEGLGTCISSGSAGIGAEGTFAKLGISKTDDLKGTTAKIINIILGFLGIVAVIIILAGGFKWMTAAGNEDKVAEARQMIIQGVIGLVIIFAAWAIASFVISSLQKATGDSVATGTCKYDTNPPACDDNKCFNDITRAVCKGIGTGDCEETVWTSGAQCP